MGLESTFQSTVSSSLRASGAAAQKFIDKRAGGVPDLVVGDLLGGMWLEVKFCSHPTHLILDHDVMGDQVTFLTIWFMRPMATGVLVGLPGSRHILLPTPCLNLIGKPLDTLAPIIYNKKVTMKTLREAYVQCKSFTGGQFRGP